MPLHPALNPELESLLADFPLIPEVTPAVLPAMRQASALPPGQLLANQPLTRTDHTTPAPDGHLVPLTVLTPTVASGACVVWLHGGGMILGDRFSQIDIPLEWLAELGVVVVTVEYRLAPEFGGSTPVRDAYAGLCWVAEHAAELGVDPERIVVAGISAGGGLAAGVTLLARDLGGPAIAAQVLICPMLDHRNDTVSSRQYAGVPSVWTPETNRFAWGAVLGAAPDDVPAYVSPALADDLAGLPATYVDAGSAEVFRDEDVAYASRIWAAGGEAELHVWAGGFHGFDAMFPATALGAAARTTRTRWLAGVLAR
ncbi:alpha/beta hydrolase [Kribbella sandramycini]|uniref:Acetyl esterase/lipase n=1 Tax=Kribbella sandramycini TaxID=60450 RepID=A0A7Y4P1W3_9ACTN|nr:alpha/beta hydrolase [Kribbella sandramycini]MBB6571257.1 acetyl esterase/lipase [Kribbella sandramycini]NOL43338.1 alpha/beta hydrolase [Kribbella sandramycini]